MLKFSTFGDDESFEAMAVNVLLYDLNVYFVVVRALTFNEIRNIEKGN